MTIDNKETTMTGTTVELADDTATTTSPGREAAKYRRQLRETEAERDTIKEQLRQARKGLVDAHLTHGTPSAGQGQPLVLRHVEDLHKFAPDLDVESLFTEDGALNVDTLAVAVENMYETRPELFQHSAPIIPDQGRSPADQTTRGNGNSFASAFGPQTQMG